MTDTPQSSARRPMFLCVALLGTLCFQGCVVGPDYYAPTTPVPDMWHQQIDDGRYASAEELDQWWLLFGDTTLNDLIECAGSNNLDLQAAYYRIEQARAQRCIVAADRWPQLASSGRFSNSLQSENAVGIGGGFSFLLGAQDFWSLGLDLSWEPDVWGRVQRSIESAEAGIDIQAEAFRDILVRLYGDIAQNYAQIRTLQVQLDYARKNAALQRSALRLAELRVNGGAAPELDRFQAESNLATTEAEIPALERQLHQLMNRMAVLIGAYPGSVHDCLSTPAPIPTPYYPLPQNVPCDVLRQRPDIRQAERNIAARSAEIGVAIADLFPRFVIGGSFALSSQEFSDLFSSDSWGYNIGPSFSWPVFQAGRIKCNIQQRNAALDEAVATYESTLLRAFEEIENSIVAYNKERNRREALAVAVRAAEKSLESVLAIYRAGQTNFQNVLDTQRTLFQAQNALAISEGQIINYLITLYKAFGGGWRSVDICYRPEIHLACPQRGYPDAIENTPVEDVTERYFNLSDEDAESDEAEAGDEDIDADTQLKLPDEVKSRLFDDDPNMRRLPNSSGLQSNGSVQDADGAGDDEDLDISTFQKTLDRLRERLKGTPDSTQPQDQN